MREAKLTFLFACRALGLFRLAQWMTRKHLKILAYHGFALADEAAFRPKLFISADRFEKRLEILGNYGFRVLPLDEALARLGQGRLPDHSLVLTIDDGFHSVYRLAAPRLERHGYPATVYVTSYYVEKARPIFRLVVQYMFWKTAKRQLELRGVPWSSDRVVDLADPKQAEQALWDCIRYGEQAGAEDIRAAICEQLGRHLGTSYEEIVRSKILHLMTPEELRFIGNQGISAELHTHRHNFPEDDPTIAERELAENRAALKSWLGLEAAHFCYPSGLWNERQWPWLERAGVRSAVTCLPGLNSPATPRLALRRFLDGENIHPLEFEAAVSGFSDLLRRRVSAEAASE